MTKNHFKIGLEQLKNYSLLNLIVALISFFSFQFCNAQGETIAVPAFKEVVISPHIEVVFQQSDEESVVIDWSKVDREKINIDSKGKKLHIYLDDAKIVGKNEKVIINGNERKQSIYKGTQLKVTINYAHLQEVEIRGEEHIDFKDAITTQDFDLDIYGSPKVNLKSITAEKFKVALYGESDLEIEDGSVDFQRYRAYGTSKVIATNLKSVKTKIAAYGSNELMVNASEKLKVSAFGDANIQYTGGATINKGLTIGDAVVQRIQLVD